MLKNRLLKMLDMYQLSQLNKKHLFTPEFVGTQATDKYIFRTVYNLSFDDKEHSFEPMINFHLAMIDFMIDNYYLRDYSTPNEYFEKTKTATNNG